MIGCPGCGIILNMILKSDMNGGVAPRPRLAVLIDADNIGPSSAGDLFQIVCRLGDPILRRAYGTPQRFMGGGGWQNVQHEFGIVSKPQISNLKGKNAADIALVIDAMECLYRIPCEGICIVSNDSDYTALAAKIREAGKSVYGIGSAKAPVSFRSACTKYIVLPKKQATVKDAVLDEPVCPRCGAKLEKAWTKSRKFCRACSQCGGMSSTIGSLRGVFDQESLGQIMASAKRLEAPGCSCPRCGKQMGIVRVASGKKSVEIDVCGSCGTVWYDKAEFETLVPDGGLLAANVSAGKAFRRDVTAAVAADLRAGRMLAKTETTLKSLLKHLFHVPAPDIQPIVDTLKCQKVITVDKKGALNVSHEQHESRT